MEEQTEEQTYVVQKLDSDEEYEIQDIQELDDYHKYQNLTFSQKKIDYDFQSIKSEIEEVEALENDQIFTRLLDEQELKHEAEGQDRCYKCQKEYSIISRKKQCNFCGNSMCRNDARKKRENPQQNGDFKYICDECEEKYIRRHCNQKFKQEKAKLDNDKSRLEQKETEIQTKKREQQKKFDQAKLRLEEDQKKYNNEAKVTGLKIAFIKKDIVSITKEENDYTKKDEDLDNEIAELYLKIEEKENSIQRKKEYEKELRMRIRAGESDIKQTQFVINEVERRLSSLNYQKTDQTKFYNGNQNLRNSDDTQRSNSTELIRKNYRQDEQQSKPCCEETCSLF